MFILRLQSKNLQDEPKFKIRYIFCFVICLSKVKKQSLISLTNKLEHKNNSEIKQIKNI